MSKACVCVCFVLMWVKVASVSLSFGCVLTGSLFLSSAGL